jgi:hypothetical protein
MRFCRASELRSRWVPPRRTSTTVSPFIRQPQKNLSLFSLGACLERSNFTVDVRMSVVPLVCLQKYVDFVLSICNVFDPDIIFGMSIGASSVKIVWQ